MKSQSRTWAIAAAAALCCTGFARAQFSDNFESYSVGAFTPGGTSNSGGWRQWDSYALAAGQGPFANDSAGGPVHGGNRALGTREAADTVHEFSTFTSGHWDLKIWTFVPGGLSPNPMLGSQWLVLLNLYADGLGAGNKWATQAEFKVTTGEFRVDNGISLVTGQPQYGVTVPLITDAWVEVLVDIDIDNDIGQIFYGGVPVGDPFTWSAGPFGTDVGVTPNIDCIDLYSNSATYAVGSGTLEFMYWDDFTITTHSVIVPPVNYCTVGTSTQGCNPMMSFSGTASASAVSGFTLMCNAVEANQSGLFFYGVANPGFIPVQWGATGTSFYCVKSPVERTGVLNSGGSIGCTGAFSRDWNAYMAANPSAIGNPRLVGTSFDAQCWMRDPPSSKTTILSDGLRFTLAP